MATPQIKAGLRERVNSELEEIYFQNGDVTAKAVLEKARHVDTALYEAFERQGLWDDKKAAEAARLIFAQRLMRTYIITDMDENCTPVRALVSLLPDRLPGGNVGSYRHIRDIRDSAELSENLLATALMELRAFKRKYGMLQQLVNVWDAIDAMAPETPTDDGPRANP